MCGEHVYPYAFGDGDQGSSPHVRGAHPAATSQIAGQGIIPACAGSTTVENEPTQESRDHPRMCGEHRAGDVPSRTAWGSSPHVRGAHELPVVLPEALGIIPACAGSTKDEVLADCIVRDHPRMCGEHCDVLRGLREREGSSPHVRGAPAAWVMA